MWLLCNRTLNLHFHCDNMLFHCIIVPNQLILLAYISPFWNKVAVKLWRWLWILPLSVQINRYFNLVTLIINSIYALKNSKYHKKSSFIVSIHFFSVYSSQGHRVVRLDSIPAVTGQRAGCTLDKLSVCWRPNTETTFYTYSQLNITN